MDDADIAQERAEREAEWSRRYSKPQARLQATGACLYCGDAVAVGVRFCDAFCRDEFERQQRAEVMAGKRPYDAAALNRKPPHIEAPPLTVADLL